MLDLPICGPDRLTAEALDGVPFAHAVVASVRYADVMRAQIEARGVAPNRVSCIEPVTQHSVSPMSAIA